MKRILALVVCLTALMVTSVTYAKPLTLDEISEAGCRVQTRIGGMATGYGSGVCIYEDTLNVYILTNAHVLGMANTAGVEFFKMGYVSPILNARVVYKARKVNTDIDFCLLAITKSSFGSYPLPRVIPLAPKGCVPQKGYCVSSAGCPEGRDLVMWQGYVANSNTSRIFFAPAPVGGQSGSGLLILVQGADGDWYTRVGAIITWRIGDKAVGGKAIGGAIPVDKLYALLEGKPQAETTSWNYHHVSQFCKHCGQPQEAHALASDGKLYCVKYVDGKPTVTLIPPVYVVRWGQRLFPNQNQNPNGGCPGGNCPGNGGGQVEPETPTPNLPPTLPNFGAPFPGLEPPKPEPAQPTVPVPDESLSQQLKDLVKQTEQLEKDNAAYQKEIVKLKAELGDGVIAQATEKIKRNPWLSTIAAGIGGGLLYLLWNIFGRKFLIKKIDSVEDLLQSKIAAKWGEEAAKDARGIMDGIDETLLGVADNFLEQKRLVNKLNANTGKTAVNAKKDQAMSILQAFQSGIEKQQNKFLASQVLSKDDILDMLKASEATEVAEKDDVGLATIRSLQERLAKIESKDVSVADAKEIIKKAAEVESKDNDTDVLNKIRLLEEKIAGLEKA